MANPAVFLDRDNTLIEDPGYIADPTLVKLLPGVEVALKHLAQAGYRLVVVTNQSGIARGMVTEEALEAIHAELRRQLAERGARVDAIYFCPFHPEGTVEKYAMESDLRKPQPGMILKAAAEMGLDLSQSWTVGDSTRDIEAGRRAGTRTIRIKAGHGGIEEAGQDDDIQADYVVRNLSDAAEIVLKSRAAPQDDPAAPIATATESDQESPGTALPGRQADDAVVAANAATAANAAAVPPATPNRIMVTPPRKPHADRWGTTATAANTAAVPPDLMTDDQLRRETVRLLRQMSGLDPKHAPFSLSKLIAGVCLAMAIVLLPTGLILGHTRDAMQGLYVVLTSIALGTLATALYVMKKD